MFGSFDWYTRVLGSKLAICSSPPLTRPFLHLKDRRDVKRRPCFVSPGDCASSSRSTVDASAETQGRPEEGVAVLVGVDAALDPSNDHARSTALLDGRLPHVSVQVSDVLVNVGYRR